jgi:hypothetical protein
MRQPTDIARLREALDMHRRRFDELQVKGLPFERDLRMFRILQRTLQCLEQSEELLVRIKNRR